MLNISFAFSAYNISPIRVLLTPTSPKAFVIFFAQSKASLKLSFRGGLVIFLEPWIMKATSICSVCSLFNASSSEKKKLLSCFVSCLKQLY
jgi:hypothetical protein